jgi:hypothetical protein
MLKQAIDEGKLYKAEDKDVRADLWNTLIW